MVAVDLAAASLSLQSQATVRAKLADLRSHLARYKVDVYLIPSADEHLNEYLPKAKQRRIWASGFTGSSGDFLLGRETAWLFVDSRYYEQADLEVDPAFIQVSKVGLDGQKTLEETLEDLGRIAQQQGTIFRLGFDPFTLSVSQFRIFQKQLEPWGMELVPIAVNLVDQVRAQQPWAMADPIPADANSCLFSLPDALTGETTAQKLKRIREDLQKRNVAILPLTKLDQIAWLYNLRGWDVPYNPVFIAYTIITQTAAYLFTNLDRIDADIRQGLQPYVTLLSYTQYADTLKSLTADPAQRILIDPRQTTMGTYYCLTGGSHKSNPRISAGDNPIEGMKARKNGVEISQMQQANLKASRAKTLTLKWIADQFASGQSFTEADVAATVEGFYAAEADFQGLSFNTIAGSGSNSSIVHYGTPNPEAVVQAGAFLLLDSGAQYASGTTDDTRTLVMGEPTPTQIERYTEVLKAHINCAMQRFPKGTTGAQLDGITRSTMWQNGLDYGHGTGHGVGAFLNVHEGPNGISKRVSEPLEPGMVTSVEPGYYEPGWGGIRIENLYLVKEVLPESPTSTELSGEKPNADKTNPGNPQTPWYEFESLTYIPFAQNLIDPKRLDARQQEWLERYHRAIVEKLSPTLSAEESEWLKTVCNF